MSNRTVPKPVGVVIQDIKRTLSIVRQLAHGQYLSLPDGNRIAMAEDMTIGIMMPRDEDGGEFISPLSEMTLRQLNDLLDEHNIGMVIPYTGKREALQYRTR